MGNTIKTKHKLKAYLWDDLMADKAGQIKVWVSQKLVLKNFCKGFCTEISNLVQIGVETTVNWPIPTLRSGGTITEKFE